MLKRCGGRIAYIGFGFAIGLGVAAHQVDAARPIVPCKTATPIATPGMLSHPANQTVTMTLSGHLWRLTLTRVVVAARLHSSFESVTAQGKFVVVFLTAANLTRKPESLGVDQDFTVLDMQGRSFDRNSDADSAAAEEFQVDDAFGDVQPTFTTHTVLAFDVAKNAHGLVLQNSDILGNHTKTVFHLGF